MSDPNSIPLQQSKPGILARLRNMDERQRRLLMLTLVAVVIIFVVVSGSRQAITPPAAQKRDAQWSQEKTAVAPGQISQFQHETQQAVDQQKEMADYQAKLNESMQQLDAQQKQQKAMYNSVQEQSMRPAAAPSYQQAGYQQSSAPAPSGTGKLVVFFEQPSSAKAEALPPAAPVAQAPPASAPVSAPGLLARIADRGKDELQQQDKPHVDLQAYDPKLPTFIVSESDVIECALINKLEGSFVGPVACMVDTPFYADGTHTVLFPQGARIVGSAKSVAGLGQNRLAVAFHRVIVPKAHAPGNYSVSLDDETPALDQQGAVGLKDKVDSHYLSIFGASLAVGAIGGLANIGNNVGTSSASSQFRSGIAESMAMSSEHVLDRFLNRMPNITIRPGTRVKVMITGDLRAPAYEEVQ